MKIKELEESQADFQSGPTRAYKTPINETELYQFMNRVLPVGQGTNYEKSVTGEDYIAYAQGCDDPNQEKKRLAVKWIWKAFLKKALSAVPGSKLYWRTPPEWEEFEDPETRVKKGRLYLRFLISPKEPVFQERTPAQYLTEKGSL